MDNNFFNDIEHNTKTYSKDQISTMNMTYPWTHSIKFQDNTINPFISQKEKINLINYIQLDIVMSVMEENI